LPPYLLDLLVLPLETAYARTLNVLRFGGALNLTVAEPSVVVLMIVNRGVVWNSLDSLTAEPASPFPTEPAGNCEQQQKFTYDYLGGVAILTHSPAVQQCHHAEDAASMQECCPFELRQAKQSCRMLPGKAKCLVA
jgi:hypothetical protein